MSQFEVPDPPKPEPVTLTPAQWAKALRDMLHTCLRRSDYPTVQKARKLIDDYDASNPAQP